MKWFLDTWTYGSDVESNCSPAWRPLWPAVSASRVSDPLVLNCGTHFTTPILYMNDGRHAERKKYDSDIATGVNYGVDASS